LHITPKGSFIASEEETIMPQDEKKRQKALMKKRSKQKVAAKAHAAQKAAATGSLKSVIRNAGSYPLLECWISSSWQKTNDMGLIQVLVARQQPDGDICFGMYLIDKYCLGVKNTLAKAGISRHSFEGEVISSIFQGAKPEKCSPELAHQMIYAAIDYAAQFGFQPQSDFALTQNVLVPRGELEEPYKLTFGKDGKPFFIAGPYDNVARVLRQLEKTAGEGNYDFMAPMGGDMLDF
jgi:hypothetical protein